MANRQTAAWFCKNYEMEYQVTSCQGLIYEKSVTVFELVHQI
jgi:hypothetical protein